MAVSTGLVVENGLFLTTRQASNRAVTAVNGFGLAPAKRRLCSSKQAPGIAASRRIFVPALKFPEQFTEWDAVIQAAFDDALAWMAGE